MEDNRPNQDLTNQDIEFIKEKVKERRRAWQQFSG